ncbi:MAG: serine/threonine protein kinase, partial [Planctomycetota bacterium]|nr:serine/threonine protein kinase [Planctomycetota bacterium]
MTPHRWEDTKRILNDALELALHERARFLDDECGDDPVLRREVERLLKESATDLPIKAEAVHESEGSYSAGQRVGDFVFERELGSGGMGIVYLATQTSLQRKVAVKVLRPGLSVSDTQIERFRREAKATAKLQHRGIVSIQAVGEENGVHYLAMDYNEGDSLDRIIEEEAGSGAARDPTRWVKLVAEVADALHYAHGEGVIHRDIKPHNIIVDAEGYPHVLDFGLAKVEALSSLSRSGDMTGTPYYMSPEQALAKRVRLDHRTDIFSLGCVLYELLAGVRPFEGETQQDVLFGITFRDPEPLKKHNPAVSAELQTICFKAMEKNPENRYATAKEFADDLRHYLADEAILARPPSVVRRARRLVRRHPKKSLAVAFALGGILVTIIALSAVDSYETRQRMPQLSVFSDRPGDAVFVQPLDYIGMPDGPEQRVGETPLDEYRLEQGYYRIVVEREGFGFAEVVRLFDSPGTAYRVDARLVDLEV